MSTQIVYVVESFQSGAAVSSANSMQQPTSLGGQGTLRDDDFLNFWGLRATADVCAVQLDNITVKRTITLSMVPSSTATGTITQDSGQVITGVTITGQGLDYIQPPLPVIADATGIGAIVQLAGLQVISAAQIFGGTGYTNPVATAVGYLAPGGTPALFSVTVMAGVITALTCTNAATNGPYAQPPNIVITDPAGTGAAYRARCGVHPKVTVLATGGQAAGSKFYTNPTISFTPYFKTLCPDSAGAAVQGSAVKGFMVGKCTAGTMFPCFELAPVVS